MAAATFLGFAGSVQALTFYSDVTAFNAAAGPTAGVPLPDVGNVGTGAYAVGPLTFDSLSGNLYLGGGFDSTLIPGTDTAISNTEDLQVDISGGTTGFGFYLHEPTSSAKGYVDVCNAACVESTFEISAFSGAALLGTWSVDPINDFANFIGVYDAGGFDQIQIIETTGGIDNEFFGGFVVSTVPVPASLPLLLAGLGGLAFMRRRR